ncbi:DUF397 domain-containing protein [Streptomyces sp. NPDC055099]
MTDLNWQKSTFSEAGGTNCVYIAASPDGAIRLRESDAPDTSLSASPEAFAALIRTLTERQ